MTSRPSPCAAALWLEARYPYDARARSKHIERIVRRDLAGRRFLRIVDFGAGLGANLRYYAEIFNGDQEWYCIERDRLLCRQFAARLEKWAIGRAWSCRVTRGRVLLRKNGNTISARLLPLSFLPFPSELSGLHLDLAMANAVFDLLSRREFVELVTALFRRSVPLLATLNYASTRFAPSRPEDRRIVGLYERHMTLPGPEGAPMGPGCVAAMEEILEDSGYQVLKGESPWTISGHDGLLLRLLFQYVESAVTSFSSPTIGGGEVGAWVAGKKAEIGSGEVRLRIRHLDLYARLPRSRASRP